MNILVVGAGFSGSTVARILAENGYKVNVIDKRSHVAGNAYDYIHDSGVRVHKYGPHIFHTNNKEVLDWLRRFSPWFKYKHKVVARLCDGNLVPFPVNVETLKFVDQKDVFDIFYKPYTKKMWGVDADKVNSSVLKRVPVSTNDSGLYFPNDKYQFLPKDGYTELFNKILDHENISINLNTEYQDKFSKTYDFIFNSMSIDEYFNYKYGYLPYRSIKFHTTEVPIPSASPHPVINFTHDGPFTRVTEWKNFPNHGFSNYSTVVTVEEPCDFTDNNFERFYPVNDVKGENRDLYNYYRSKAPSNMLFIGRCGLYAYIDMDQAVSSATSIAKKFILQHGSKNE